MNLDIIYLFIYAKLKQSAVITVYETQANLADHEKIQGTEGALSSPHT